MKYRFKDPDRVNFSSTERRGVRKFRDTAELKQSEDRALRNKVRAKVEIALGNLDAAKEAKAHLVMTGDWGGQVYLTAPAKMVSCDEKTLEKMLAELDQMLWVCNQGSGASLYFQEICGNEYVSGGMGGGKLEEELWVHPSLKHMERQIADVLMKGAPLENNQ